MEMGWARSGSTGSTPSSPAPTSSPRGTASASGRRHTCATSRQRVSVSRPDTVRPAYPLPVPTSDPLTTCRYVSDGRLARRITRESWARLRRPSLLVSFVAFGVALGVVGSLSSNAGSLPDHLGRVLLIGVVWGVGWLMIVTALAAVVVVPLVRWRERRIAAQYPGGSVTEIAVGADALMVVRPSGKR